MLWDPLQFLSFPCKKFSFLLAPQSRNVGIYPTPQQLKDPKPEWPAKKGDGRREVQAFYSFRSLIVNYLSIFYWIVIWFLFIYKSSLLNQISTKLFLWRSKMLSLSCGLHWCRGEASRIWGWVSSRQSLPFVKQTFHSQRHTDLHGCLVETDARSVS